jgi:hypothetical protein
MYDVAPVDASQLAVKDVCPTFVAAVATGGRGGNTCDAAPVIKRQYARASEATNLGIISPFISLLSSPPASHRLLMTSSAAGFLPLSAATFALKYETSQQDLGLFSERSPLDLFISAFPQVIQ